MPIAAALLLAVAPVSGQAAARADAAAIDRAIAACEAWLLDPASWIDDIPAFGRQRGLEPQGRVPELALPAPSQRVAMHHWRAPLRGGGLYLTTSDRVPFCHLSGAAAADLEPAVVEITEAADFTRRWRRLGETARGEMVTARYAAVADPELTMTLSHAAMAGARTDRVQLLATLQYEPGNTR